MGVALRQLRRQQGMTQTELGGEQFSKSYVSAVEHDKIVPSYEALRHFSRQLGQPPNYFEQYIPRRKPSKFPFPILSPAPSHHENDTILGKALTLLDVLGEGSAFPGQYFAEDVPLLNSDVLTTLPREKQAAYSFLLGYQAKQEGNITEALSRYEFAQGTAVLKYHPVILDEIGTCYALSHAYHRALDAHCRALDLLEVGTVRPTLSSMRLRIELHCAQDYQALGRYRIAEVHYGNARNILQSNHDVQTAAQIYSGLGYCSYASVFQTEKRSSPLLLSNTEEEKGFQQANNYLVQANALYRIGNEPAEESRTRLTQVMVLLDDCTFHQRGRRQHATEVDRAEMAHCVALLEAAEEQCRQILTIEQEEDTSATPLPEHTQARLLLLLASLLSIYVQRATLASANGDTETAKHARARALWFGQQTLIALNAASSLSYIRLEELMNAPTDTGKLGKATLPPLPPLPPLSSFSLQESQAELSLTIGMLTELLAETAATSVSRDDYFTQADDLFQNALSLWKAIRQEHLHATMPLRRGYYHVISMLEERIAAYPSLREQNVQTLVQFLKEGLQHTEPFS